MRREFETHRGEGWQNPLTIFRSGKATIFATDAPEQLKSLIDDGTPITPDIHPDNFHYMYHNGIDYFSTSESWLKDIQNGASVTFTAPDYGPLIIYETEDTVIASRRHDISDMIKNGTEFSPQNYPDGFYYLKKDGVNYFSSERSYLENVKASTDARNKLAAIEKEPTPRLREAFAKDLDTIYEGRPYRVPAEYEEPLRRLTQGDPISYEIMVRLLGSESNFRDIQSPTGAVSAAQFVGATLRQEAWRNRTLLSPHAQTVIKNNIAKVNTAPKGKDPVYEYKIKNGGSQQAIKDLLKDPETVITLAMEYARFSTEHGKRRLRAAIRERLAWLKNPASDGYPHDPERIARLEEHLTRPMNQRDVKTFYFSGANGGSKSLLAYADLKTQQPGLEHKAKDYTPDYVVRHNRLVFEHSDGRDRNVTEYMAYMGERVGNNIALSETLDRPTTTAALDIKLD